jgi:hypothetical protein
VPVTKPAQMRTTDEIAAELNRLLKERQADAKLNGSDKTSGRDLFGAGAYAVNKSTVSVCYVTYQGGQKMTREVANGYLDWLLEDGRWRKAKHFPRTYEYTDMKKSYQVDNLFYVAEEGHRPVPHDQTRLYYKSLAAAYYTFLTAVGTRTPRGKDMSKYTQKMIPNIGDFYPSGQSPTYYALSKEAQDAANKLFEEMQLAIRKAYARGLDHGRDLLAQLTRGEITLGEFEKKVPVEVRRDWKGRVLEEGEEE